MERRNMNNIGIISHGVYTPPKILTSKDISILSGIPEQVIREKFGFTCKHKAEPDEHVSDMGIAAGKKALQDIDPDSIDLVIYYGSEYKDYHVWPVGAAIMEGLGIKKAYAFEMMALCATGAMAFQVAKNMIEQDPEINRVLLVAASKEGDLINYGNQRSRFMYNFGDGAAACVIGKGASNRILASAAITDGRFARDVYMPIGGSVTRPGKIKIEAEHFYLDVPQVENMKNNLDPISLDNFCRVISRSVTKAGFQAQKINFIGITHMKRSFYEAILQRFNLSWEHTFYLEEYGHVQAADQVIIISEAEKRGLLQPGDLVVLAGAGTGYTWSAVSLLWGV